MADFGVRGPDLVRKQRPLSAWEQAQEQIATLRARAEAAEKRLAAAEAQVDERQEVGARIQEAATGEPGPLSDSDVIAELTALRARVELLQGRVERRERDLDKAKTTLHEWQVANRNRVWVARAQRAEAQVARVWALAEKWVAMGPYGGIDPAVYFTVRRGKDILAALDGEGGAS